MAPRCAQLSKRHIALVPAIECTSSRAPCRALPFLPPHLAHYTVRSLPWRAHLCSDPSAEAERRSVPSHREVRSHRSARSAGPQVRQMRCARPSPQIREVRRPAPGACTPACVVCMGVRTCYPHSDRVGAAPLRRLLRIGMCGALRDVFTALLPTCPRTGLELCPG